MGGGHDIQPFLPRTFAFGDQPAYPITEDFRTGTGQGVQSRLFQGFQDFGVRGLFQLGDVRYLRRAQSM